MRRSKTAMFDLDVAKAMLEMERGDPRHDNIYYKAYGAGMIQSVLRGVSKKKISNSLDRLLSGGYVHLVDIRLFTLTESGIRLAMEGYNGLI